jgi:hypothetical protein
VTVFRIPGPLVRAVPDRYVVAGLTVIRRIRVLLRLECGEPLYRLLAGDPESRCKVRGPHDVHENRAGSCWDARRPSL